MQTLVEYDDFENWPRYFIVEGDWSKFDGVIINSTDSPEVLQEELCDLMIDDETGYIKLENEVSLEDIAFANNISSDTLIIRVAFLP